MAVTLTETVGSASANTYATLAEAQTYFENRLGGEKWPADDADKCGQAMLTAMRILESLAFIGGRSSGTQRLQWPRVAIRPIERNSPHRMVTGYEVLNVSSGLYDGDGRLWSASVIPQPVKDAQCEIAYAMLLDPALNDPALIQATLRSGGLTIDHRQPAVTRLRMAFESLSGLLMCGTRVVKA